MIKILLSRLQQKFRTIKFPSKEISLPPRYRGLPRLDYAKCPVDCRQCRNVCPTGALDCVAGSASERPAHSSDVTEKRVAGSASERPAHSSDVTEKRGAGKVTLDLGLCLFCGECAAACPNKCVSFSGEYRQAVFSRSDLVLRNTLQRGKTADERIKKLFGRSLKLRQVSAGGCNACEMDTNVLNTAGYDLGRFGIQFVASPRHADGILVTGPVTQNMRLALEKTYEAVPAPKLVIAVGTCAISGGLYRDNVEAGHGLETILPVDLYVPGCPPHPLTILDGLLRLLGRV